MCHSPGPMNEARRRFADELYEISHAHDQDRFTSLIEAAPGLTRTVVTIGAGVRLAVRDGSRAH